MCSFFVRGWMEVLEIKKVVVLVLVARLRRYCAKEVERGSARPGGKGSSISRDRGYSSIVIPRHAFLQRRGSCFPFVCSWGVDLLCSLLIYLLRTLNLSVQIQHQEARAAFTTTPTTSLLLVLLVIRLLFRFHPLLRLASHRKGLNRQITRATSSSPERVVSQFHTAEYVLL
jgi:hypothetical protein